MCLRRTILTVNGGRSGPRGLTACDVNAADAATETIDATKAKTAASELARHGPAEDGRGAKRTIAAVMRSVGEELGNTAAVARESYVSPAVLDAYLAGRTLDDYRRASRRPPRMSQDERALVRLLGAVAR